jgi:hypothetical protein
MNWEAIGSIAEVVGALAVLITLVYLAIQTRDNVKVMRSRAIWDAQVSFVEVNELLGNGGVVASVVYKAITEPENLTDQETYQLHRFCRGWFQRMEAQFALYKAGILDGEVWELRRGYAQGIVAKSPFKEWWELDKKNSMFTRAFIESMDSGAQAIDIKFMGASSEQ